MSTIKIRMFVFTALFISLCVSGASYASEEQKKLPPEYSESSATIKTVSDIESEEYEVYVAVFAAGKLDGMPFGYVVLEQKTLKEKIRKDNWKDIDEFMIDDFNKKNEKEHFIENRFPSYSDLTIKVRTQKGDRKSILDWNKEPASLDSGRTSISRVGFNKDRTKALVYTQHVAGPEMGVGHYVFLDKVDGKWIIAGSIIGRIF